MMIKSTVRLRLKKISMISDKKGLNLPQGLFPFMYFFETKKNRHKLCDEIVNLFLFFVFIIPQNRENIKTCA